MRHALLVLALCAVAAGAAPLGQAPAPARSSPSPSGPARESRGQPTGTAIIRGRVVADQPGARQAIPYARVSIAPAGVAEPVFADGEGGFQFTGLAGGRYTLTSEKTGYARTRYGATNDLEPPFAIDITDAAAVDRIEIRMPKGAAVTGRIVDDLGEPVVGVMISAGQVERIGNHDRLVTISRPDSTTNDRGDYRIGGLPAGRYYVIVAPASEGAAIFGMPVEWSRTIGWGRTLFPAASSLVAASPIVLAAGEERGAVDFALAPVQSATLSMSLSDAAGAPAGGLVNLVLAQDGLILANRAMPFDPGTPKRTMILDPGEWIAVALIGNDVAGVSHITVASGEEASVALTPTRGSRIAGRIVFDGSAALPPLSSIRLEARQVGLYTGVPIPPRRAVTVKPDGSFEMTNLFGVVEIETAAAPRGWTIAAVMRGDRDLLDEPLALGGGDEFSDLRVVLTDRLVQLTGVTTARDGEPFPGCEVALFPDAAEPRFGSRRMRLLRADSNGRFTAPDLLAGTYLAAAAADIDAPIWQTLDYLNRLRVMATRLTLAGGESRNLSLSCGSVR
jgi:carboxypeptidase family protein